MIPPKQRVASRMDNDRAAKRKKTLCFYLETYSVNFNPSLYVISPYWNQFPGRKKTNIRRLCSLTTQTTVNKEFRGEPVVTLFK